METETEDEARRPPFSCAVLMKTHPDLFEEPWIPDDIADLLGPPVDFDESRYVPPKPLWTHRQLLQIAAEKERQSEEKREREGRHLVANDALPSGPPPRLTERPREEERSTPDTFPLRPPTDEENEKGCTSPRSPSSVQTSDRSDPTESSSPQRRPKSRPRPTVEWQSIQRPRNGRAHKRRREGSRSAQSPPSGNSPLMDCGAKRRVGPGRQSGEGRMSTRLANATLGEEDYSDDWLSDDHDSNSSSSDIGKHATESEVRRTGDPSRRFRQRRYMEGNSRGTKPVYSDFICNSGSDCDSKMSDELLEPDDNRPDVSASFSARKPGCIGVASMNSASNTQTLLSLSNNAAGRCSMNAKDISHQERASELSKDHDTSRANFFSLKRPKKSRASRLKKKENNKDRPLKKKKIIMSAPTRNSPKNTRAPTLRFQAVPRAANNRKTQKTLNEIFGR